MRLSPDLAPAILAGGLAISLVILALAALISARSNHSGWSFGFSFKRDNEPPLDQNGSPALPSPQTTEAPSPDEQEHP